jgi:hypothetical protein
MIDVLINLLKINNKIIMNKNYTIIIPSNRDALKDELITHLRKMGEEPVWKNGHGYPSFSKLINECVVESPTETIIICNDKARPKKEHLLEQGYGFAGLYAWGFFGLKKELFRNIGFMDERFVGGNYEDSDYLRRMMEGNIAMYNSFEIDYIFMNSGWDISNTKTHFDKKWEHGDLPGNKYVKRLLPEEVYNYHIGKKTNIKFLPWSESFFSIDVGKSETFMDYKIKT